MRGKKWLTAVLFAIALLAMTMTANAKWVASGSTYQWASANGTLQQSEWIAAKNVGFVTYASGAKYCLSKTGARVKGFLDTGKGIYYMDSTGKVLIKSWIRKDGYIYRAGKDGKLYQSKIVKLGENYYGFDKLGRVTGGFASFGGYKYYFDKANYYRMVRSKMIKVDSKYYYLASDGKMAAGKWVWKRYFDKYGVLARSKWVSDRYVGGNGVYITGLKQIGSYYYFFNDTGHKIVSQTKTIDGVKYEFDSSGRGKVATNIPTPKVSVESTYYTDPDVDDVTLLAAIICAESANQPYYGQMAVGYVITNRISSSLFPNTLREVIYQKQQFEPARNGTLTRYMKTPSLVPTSCKTAAAEVLKNYKANKTSINVNGTIRYMRDYLFFMTPAAYSRLGLKSPKMTLDGHVFFKTWVR